MWLNGKQAQLGVPHSRIQVELGFILQAGTCQILNFAKNPSQSQSGKNYIGGDTAQKKRLLRGGGHRTYFVDEGNTWGGDTAQHRKMGGGHRTYFVDEEQLGWGHRTT